MRDYIRDLREYKVALPLTFAVVSRFLNESDTMEKRTIARAGHRVIQSLNALIMRTATVQRTFIPSNLEVPIINWGKEVMNSLDSTTPCRINAEIIQNDGERIWDDDAFRTRVAQLSFPKARDANRKAKRLLYTLYKYSQNDIQSDKNLTLEHILPESPGHIAGQPHFTMDNHERFALMPGNMTLLARADNKSTAGFNQSFENKRETLQNSAIQQNKIIANNENWTPKTISDRQRKLARIACQVWKPSNPKPNRNQSNRRTSP